jgi:hypothetical protein
VLGSKKEDEMKNRFSDYLPFILFFSVNLFWLLASWPISMSPDSLDVWGQVQSGDYRNDHPVTYTIFVKIFSLGGRYLPLVSATQLFLLSTGILLTTYTLSKNLKQSAYITSIIMLAPTAGALATTLWKDVPFVGLILIGLSLLFRKSNIFGLLTLTLGASFRHNGWLMLFTIAGVILIAAILKNKYLKHYFWKIVAAGAISFLLIISASKLIDAKPASTWLTWSPAMADLAYLASRTPNDASSIHETVALYSSGESLARSADCTNVNGLIFSSGFNQLELDGKIDQIIREYVKLIKSDPRLILRLHLCRAQAFIPPPFSTGPSYYYWTQMIILQPNDFNLIPNPPIKKVRDMGLNLWRFWDSNLKTLLWPGLITLVSSLIFLVNFIGRSNYNKQSWVFWFLTMWAALFSFIPWSNAQDFRYALLSYLVAQIIILTALVESSILFKRKFKKI